MTEEEKLRSAPGCGSLIMLGLIVIVILSLVGLIFPVDILPYPDEILAIVLVIAVIALIVSFFMWRGRVKDRKQEADDKAENVLRHRIDTLGERDDAATKLAEKYKEKSDKNANKESE